MSWKLSLALLCRAPSLRRHRAVRLRGGRRDTDTPEPPPPTSASSRSRRTRSRSRWNASTDNSGKPPRLHRRRHLPPGEQHDQDVQPGSCRTGRRPTACRRWTRSGNVSPLSQPVTATTAPDTHGADHPDQPAGDRHRSLHRVTGPGSLVRPLVVQLRGADGRPVSSPRRRIRSSARRSPRCARSHRGRHVFQVRARDNAGNVSDDEQLGHGRTLRGTAIPRRRRAPTNLTVEDLNDNCGSLILEMDTLDRQLRRPVGGSSTSSTGTAASSSSPPPGTSDDRHLHPNRAPRPGQRWRSTARGTAQARATR